MTSSAPFPGEPTLSELSDPKHGLFVKLEGGHIRGMVPSFYHEHSNPEEVVVTTSGVPLLCSGKSFTVAQIPIERRWAVLPNGEVMGELEFRKFHTMWYEEWFRELARENPELENVDGGRPDCDIPDPCRYVAVQVDPANPKQFTPVNYEPHKTTGARSKEFYTRDGEAVDEDRLKVLCNAWADPNLRGRLKPAEVEEVKMALGISSGGGNETATKLELLNSMLAAGDLTTEQHSRQVSLLTGAATSEPAEASEPTKDPPPAEGDSEKVDVNPDEPPTFTATARCGKQFAKGSKQGAHGAVGLHQQKCPSCKET